MDSYQKFYNNYSNRADIYIVYILEAHFVEKSEDGQFIGGWPIGYQYNYGQPKIIEERIKMVEALLKEFHTTIPILVDTMDNTFQNAYRPWPDRAFMFLNGKTEYVARVNDDGTRNASWTDEIEKILKIKS